MRDWFDLQNKLFKNISSDLRSKLKEPSKSLQRYQREYERDFKQMRLSQYSQLVQNMNRADIVLIGDFHSLRQSQRLLLKLLRDPRVRPPTSVGFEVLPPEQEASVNRLPSLSKRARLNLQESLAIETDFGSSFTNYEEVFETLSEKQIQIFGIKTKSTQLKSRDQFAAERISQFEGPTWILAGEFHCSSTHLPLEIHKINKKLKICVVHQNVDRLHLQYLNKMTLARDLVLEKHFSSHLKMFCVLHTPLWVKWQSYLQNHIERENELHPIDPRDQIEWSLKELQQFFEDPRYPNQIGIEELLDFQVFSAEDESFAGSLKSLSQQQSHEVMRNLGLSKVAILESRHLIYLSESNLNSCAQAAGAYLFYRWTKAKLRPEDEYDFILREFYSFFLSKILNHSRKATRFITAPKNRSEVLIGFARQLADSCFEAFLAGEFSKQRIIRQLSQPSRSSQMRLLHLLELYSVAQDFDLSNRRYL